MNIEEALSKYTDEKRWGWYRLHPERWLRHLASDEPMRVLEIGAYDGVSANMMLDSVFRHPASEVHTIDPYLSDPTTPGVGEWTRELFEQNCRRGEHGDKIRLYEGTSVEVLAWMLGQDAFWESFDVVFVDGSHLAKDVFTDAAMVWPLLKAGGILVFDDYRWGMSEPSFARPKEAIDAFEAAFVAELAPVWDGEQRFFRKVGVAGGLRNRGGERETRNCVILGTFNSGSTVIAHIMESFGYMIGRPTWGEFGESAALRERLVGWFGADGMSNPAENSRVTAGLKTWGAAMASTGVPFCAKHPLLSLCRRSLVEAWSNITIIRASRPLEDSIQELKRRVWFDDAEQIQRRISGAIDEVTSGKEFIEVDFGRLMNDSAREVDQLVEALGIEISNSRRRASAALVNGPGATAKLLR